ncbi:MAG: hypothetical protein KIT33_15370 [Candidatus Kapabacteria bacterium]|nr:hypothetical protein [Ignavibacteriota bacterium]MCW5886349.1 hypothetical protein [Candidatus Kapabacteria bacterium]
MTVAELIETLQDFDLDMEVRIAHQPNWPFEYSIESIWQDEEGEYSEAIYLVEGSQLGYFTKRAWE